MSALADLFRRRQSTDRRKLWHTPDHPSFWFDSRIQGAAAAATASGRVTKLVALQSNGANGAIRRPSPRATKSLLRRCLSPIRHRRQNGCSASKGLGSARHPRFVRQAVAYRRSERNDDDGADSRWSLRAIRAGQEIRFGLRSTRRSGPRRRQSPQAIPIRGTSGADDACCCVWRDRFAGESRVIPLALQDGDTGVQSVQSVTVLATTGTAGNFGIVIAKPILYAPCEIAGALRCETRSQGCPARRKS